MNTDGHTWASLDSTESTPDPRGKGMDRARSPARGATVPWGPQRPLPERRAGQVRSGGPQPQHGAGSGLCLCGRREALLSIPLDSGRLQAGADGSATLRRHRRPDGPQPALFLQAAPRSSFFIVIGQLGQKAQRANSPASRETPVRTDAFAGPATRSSGPTGVSLALALGGVQRAGGA